jgi:hypothetical protein
VIAGADLHEFDEPLPETRLEGPYHPGSRAANYHAWWDSDGQGRGSRRFVVHVGCFAVDLRRQDVAQGIGRERGLLERDDPREGQVLGENEGRRQSRAGVTRLFFEPLVEPPLELFRIVGDQARGQASGKAAERHVRDAQQIQRFEGAVRARNR